MGNPVNLAILFPLPGEDRQTVIQVADTLPSSGIIPSINSVAPVLSAMAIGAMGVDVRGLIMAFVLAFATSAHGMSPAECRAVADQKLVKALRHSRGVSTDVVELLRDFGADAMSKTIEVIEDVAMLERTAWKAHDLSLEFCRLIEEGASPEDLQRAANTSLNVQRAVIDLLREDD